MANGDGQRPQGITPSVIIGLGGTGKHVIMRLRKLMASHYGRIKDFPVVAYLVVDTDPTEELDPSLVIEDFRLTPSELIEAVIPNATTIFRGLEEGHQKHIRSWFNYEKLKSHTDLKKGADSVRQLGRLCFYWNYPQVRQRLEDARMQIEAEANQDFVKSKRLITPVHTAASRGLHVRAQLTSSPLQKGWGAGRRARSAGRRSSGSGLSRPFMPPSGQPISAPPSTTTCSCCGRGPGWSPSTPWPRAAAARRPSSGRLRRSWATPAIRCVSHAGAGN